MFSQFFRTSASRAGSRGAATQNAQRQTGRREASKQAGRTAAAPAEMSMLERKKLEEWTYDWDAMYVGVS